MKQYTYHLVYVTQDESGNDDGIFRTKQMTDTEANNLNQALYANLQNVFHWVKNRPISEPLPLLTHID